MIDSEKVKELLISGNKPQEIAEILGINVFKLWQVCKTLGYNTKTKKISRNSHDYLTEDDITRLAEMYNSKVSTKHIMKTLNIKRTATVYKWVEKLGLKRRRVTSTPEQVADIIQMRASGMTYGQISIKTGRPVPTIQKIVTRC
jgi:hypothetical protein